MGVEAVYVSFGGDLSLVGRVGEMIDVNNDSAIEDLRCIRWIHISPGAESTGTNRPSLNESGKLTFLAQFDDDSAGIFVAQTGILLGDVNGDGSVDLLDIAPFVNAITVGTYIPEADVNTNGIVDLLDVAPFVDLLSGM